MSSIPAICERCSTVFPSGFSGSGGSEMYMYGNKSGPCPNCGGMGYVADGLYKAYDKIIEVFEVDDGKDLDKLFSILNKVKEDINLSKLEDDINDQVPQYKVLIDWMRDMLDRNSSFVTLVPLILTIISFFQSNIDSNNDTTDEFFEQLYENQTKIIEVQEQQMELIKDQQKDIKKNKEELDKIKNNREEN